MSEKKVLALGANGMLGKMISLHLNSLKFFEVTVEVVVATLKNGKDKKVKEIYLVDSQSVTEAESRVVKDFEDSGVQIDYKVVGAKESRILRVIE